MYMCATDLEKFVNSISVHIHVHTYYMHVIRLPPSTRHTHTLSKMLRSNSQIVTVTAMRATHTGATPADALVGSGAQHMYVLMSICKSVAQSEECAKQGGRQFLTPLNSSQLKYTSSVYICRYIHSTTATNRALIATTLTRIGVHGHGM